MEMATAMQLCNNSYTSVPPSPNRISFSPHAMQFYNAPSTPKTASSGFPDDGYEDDADFEFETSLHMQQKQEPQCKQELVPMAFADELFCNGKVMPLKPPPRLQYANNRRWSASSPTSDSSVLKSPFHRWSFNKRDTNEFDPFMAALEKVRSETGGRGQTNTHRRTRSVSPLGSPKGDVQLQHQNKERDSQKPVPRVGSARGERTERKKPTLTRPVSCKGSSCNRPVEATVTTLSKGTIKGDAPSHKGNKRITTKGRSDSEDRPKRHTEAPNTHPDLRNLSFKAIHKAHYNGQKALVQQELRRRTLIPYKAQCMLVCLGFGHGGLRDLN